jgi:hypothetical protein
MCPLFLGCQVNVRPEQVERIALDLGRWEEVVVVNGWQVHAGDTDSACFSPSNTSWGRCSKTGMKIFSWNILNMPILFIFFE